MKEICAGVNSSEDRREKKVTEWAKQLKTVREILVFLYHRDNHDEENDSL